MDAWTIWIIVAAALLITEVLTQMMWALCLAIGSLVALVCALLGLAPLWQFTTLICGALAAYIALLPWFRRRHGRLQSKEDRTGMDALLGRRAYVTHAIHPGKLGRARIDGDNWQVRMPDTDVEIPAGTEVIVTAYDSIILTVALPSDN